MKVKDNQVVYSRIKQIKNVSFYETDNKCLPQLLNQFIRIEKERGLHNGKHIVDWLRAKHPILNLNKRYHLDRFLKTHFENFFHRDFQVKVQRNRLTSEFGETRELVTKVFR